MYAIRVACAIVRFQRLQALFNLAESCRIEQLAQVAVAKQFFELRLIDRKRLRSAFRERRIPFVNVIRDVGEQQ